MFVKLTMWHIWKQIQIHLLDTSPHRPFTVMADYSTSPLPLLPSFLSVPLPPSLPLRPHRLALQPAICQLHGTPAGVAPPGSLASCGQPPRRREKGKRSERGKRRKGGREDRVGRVKREKEENSKPAVHLCEKEISGKVERIPVHRGKEKNKNAAGCERTSSASASALCGIINECTDISFNH